jgi:hypothetical protein
MHWGHFHDNVGEMASVDFHLAGPGTLQFRPSVQAKRIPLCSRNFTRECFRDLGLPKYWDIINVSRPIRLKNLDQFLLVVRKICDKGYSPKVLLICPHPSAMDERDGWYTQLQHDYERLFSVQEREHVTLLMLNTDDNPFPLPSDVLSHVFNSSRILALFSDQEGESRVIAEALLCGLSVVVKRGLRGGGLDYLDDVNSRQFETLDEASEMFIELMRDGRAPRFDPREAEELSERHSVPKLVDALRQLFADARLDFEGDLDLVDLGRKLPGHHLSLPPSLRKDLTNDLRSEEAAVRYMNLLCGRELTWTEERRLTFEALSEVAAEPFRQLRRAAGDRLAQRMKRNRHCRPQSQP